MHLHIVVRRLLYLVKLNASYIHTQLVQCLIKLCYVVIFANQQQWLIVKDVERVLEYHSIY